MSELEDGKTCKDLWDFSVERGNIDTETHPIGVLGAGLRSYVAALEVKLEAMERKLQRVIRAGDELCKVTEDENVVDNWHEIIEWADAASQQERED
mgnify:CR=1 FL=1